MRQHTDSSLGFGMQHRPICQKKKKTISIKYIVFNPAVTARDDFADI